MPDISGQLGMRTRNPYFDEEAEAAHRQLDRERYLGKFEPIFQDIELSIIALEVLSEYDSAAKEAARGLRDALTDARWTVESNA